MTDARELAKRLKAVATALEQTSSRTTFAKMELLLQSAQFEAEQAAALLISQAEEIEILTINLNAVLKRERDNARRARKELDGIR